MFLNAWSRGMDGDSEKQLKTYHRAKMYITSLINYCIPTVQFKTMRYFYLPYTVRVVLRVVNLGLPNGLYTT